MARTMSVSTQAATRPKRKHAEVSYAEDPYEGIVTDAEKSSDDSEDDSEVDIAPTRKKLKANSTVAVAFSKTLSKNKVFPFMELPGELRNKIYAIALTHYEEIHLVNRIKGLRRIPSFAIDSDFRPRRTHQYALLNNPHPAYMPAKPLGRPHLRPNTLRLNRQIYNEAQPILYGSNTFTFKDSTALLSFSVDIGETNMAALQHVSIKEWGESGVAKGNNYAGFTCLASAVNLTRLDLDCKIHSSSHDSARQFFREAHRWVEAVMRKKKDKNAVVDIVHPHESTLGNGYPNRSTHPLTGVNLESEIKVFRAELKGLI